MFDLSGIACLQSIIFTGKNREAQKMRAIDKCQLKCVFGYNLFYTKPFCVRFYLLENTQKNCKIFAIFAITDFLGSIQSNLNSIYVQAFCDRWIYITLDDSKFLNFFPCSTISANGKLTVFSAFFNAAFLLRCTLVGCLRNCKYIVYHKLRSYHILPFSYIVSSEMHCMCAWLCKNERPFFDNHA